MFRKQRYIFNKETLSYEIEKVSLGKVARSVGLVLALGLASFALYGYLYVKVLGYEPPKSAIIENRNSELIDKIELINERMDEYNARLVELQRRDNVVYRPIFGMDEISSEVRNAGFGGIDRYSYLEDLDHSDFLVSSAMKMDILSKKIYVQSRSYDDVALLAKRTGDMAACVPSINPVNPKSIRISSSFGYRVHPIKRAVIFHEGIDFSGKKGEPVFVTGDGVVESVMKNFFGYGNLVVVDHGFGYKTKYAHLKDMFVREGDKVVRGDQIATIGNSGQSTGPHLHYEVIYKGRQINPWNFIDMDMSRDEYSALTRLARKN
ncbi:MAG: M23 family metallopeptidase [Bacteroidales bacterium]|nr:M23 family metallopeptidase [Candidatus Cacconaster merdequi]